MTEHKFSKSELSVGLTLFIIAFLLGLKFRFWGIFVDEGDNFSAGRLMAHGSILYKDIFSHHFPFPYFWVMGIIKIFGASVNALRISLVIFVMGALGWTMWLTKRYVVIGAMSLFWMILGHFYAGNIIMYSVFSGISLTVVVSIVLFTMMEGKKFSDTAVVTISIFSAIAILADPLSIYAVGFTIIAVLWLERRAGVKYVLLLGSWGGLFLIYLGMTHSLTDFYQSAVLFNRNVYSNYFPANPMRLQTIVKLLFTFLGITNPQYFNLDLWYPLKTIFPGGIDNWIFTGFLLRFSVLVYIITLLFKKQWKSAGYLYAIAISLVAIHPNGFRFIPFVSLSFLVTSLLIIEVVYRITLREKGSGAIWQKWGFRLLVSFQMTVLLMFGWLLFRGIDFAWQNVDKMNYTTSFAKEVKRGADARTWACGNPNVKLAYYPGDPYVYYFSQLKPVSKYLFMFPWVADIAQNDVIATLNQTPAIVYFKDLEHVQIWGYPEKEYLAPLIATVQAQYRRFGLDVYVHPTVYDACVAGYQLTADFLLAEAQVTGVDKNYVTVDIIWNGSPSVYDEKRSNFYTAYVQVIDTNGNRMAGSDIQIDSDNVQVVDETTFKQQFDVALPTDTPPGLYGLKIGTYFFENGKLVDISSIRQPDRIELN